MTNLRRGLLGLAFLGSMGFGVTQAFGSPEQAVRAQACPAKAYDYPYAACRTGCPAGGGYCATNGYCACGPLP
ncbi:MAG TPA: hypothetical protein VGX50_03215 [Longimicrobium sp.]|jgi:hypothetical protein|nr:hypothetical protein [Longimicrobium sp.]